MRSSDGFVSGARPARRWPGWSSTAQESTSLTRMIWPACRRFCSGKAHRQLVPRLSREEATARWPKASAESLSWASWTSTGHHGPLPLAHHDTAEVMWLEEVEDDDGHAIVHAHGKGGGVHDLELLL